jgi:ankyrin repeat protein
MDIFSVIELNDLEGVNQWLKTGPDINKPDNRGRTPIYCASYKGHTEIVKLLLAQPGIDFNKPINNKWTPINNASNFGRTEIVHILKEYQKNPIKMRNVYLREYFPQIIEEYFILMVLCSDDYFICVDQGDIGRFFTMVVVLPQELQALIANRIVGSSYNIPKLFFINEAIEKFLIKKLIFFLIKIIITI